MLTSSAIYDWTHTYDDAARQAVLTVLDGLAEFERELILARTNDGRVRAKAPWREIWPASQASGSLRAQYRPISPGL